MVKTANEIFRDFVTDGVPSSGVHNPYKPDIREWGTSLEDFQNNIELDFDSINNKIAVQDDRLEDLEQETSSINLELISQSGRISELEDAEYGSLIVAATWASLMTITGTFNGQAAEVPSSDGGTHLQATVSGYDGVSVANAGRYSWNDTWNRWVWISADGLSLKANKTETIITRTLTSGENRTTKGISVAGSIDVAEAKPGDNPTYIPPIEEVITARKPLVVSSDKKISLGDGWNTRIAVDPLSSHPIINGRGIVPSTFAPGTVVTDSAGFIRAMDDRTPKYAGEWVPDLELIKADDPPKVIFDIADSYYATRTFQLIGSIERVGNRLWAAFYGSHSRTDEGPPSHMIVKYSDDEGVTWTINCYLAYEDSGGNPIETKRCVDPRFFVDDDGLLWLLVPVSSTANVYDNIFGTFAFVIRDATGPKPIWSKPFQLSPYGISARPYKVGHKLNIPIDVWRQSLSLNPGKTGKHLYEFDTRRRAALRIATLPDIVAPTFDESSGVELSNGDLFHIFRTPYGQVATPGTHAQFFSKSTDSGFTWTAPAALTALPGNPPSRAIMRRTPGGRIAIVFNSSVHPLRQNLTIAFSEDEGVTFPYTCLLDGVNSYVAYPEMCFGTNGKIYVLYDSRYMPGCPIRLAIVDETDARTNGNAATVTRRDIDVIP